VSTISAPSAAGLLAGTSLLPYRVLDQGVLYRISAAPAAVGALFCESCGAKLGGNGSRRLSVMDLPLHQRAVKIEVDAPRFVCPICGRSRDVRPADLHPQRQMTARLVAYIERAGLERPYTDIAREVGVGPATIAKICRAYAKRLNNARRLEMPEILCIDEVHIVMGTAYAVFSDHDAVLVIEMLEDTKQKTVMRGLRRLRARKRCRVVCIDMCHRYRDAVRAVLPQALVVIDKRHVLDMARRNLVTVIGEQYRRWLSPCPLTLLALKGLMIEHRGELTTKERTELDAELAKAPYLQQAYDAKERFFKLYAAASHEAAAAVLDAWLGSLSQGMGYVYADLVTALGNWRSEILNYWRTSRPVTNGPAEGLNSVIKRINDSGGGGMKFELLRARVVFGEPQRRAREALRKAVARTRRRAARP
jgi:transposase